MRTVLIVLFDGVQSLDVTGPLEVFAGANLLLSRRDGQDDNRPRYQIRTASLGGGPVRTSSGLRLVPDQDLNGTPGPDVPIVPGG
jgi:transcriptional regulator GlxA family with amidase domain